MWDAQGRLSQWLRRFLGDFLGHQDFTDLATGPAPLESTDPLPLVVDDITPAWLSKVLHVQVDAIKVEEVLHGAGSKVLLEAIYRPSTAAHAAALTDSATTSTTTTTNNNNNNNKNKNKNKPLPPTRLCIKGGFNPELLAMLPTLFAVYRLEAQFYHHIAPQIPGLRLLPTYWCGVDHPSGKGQGLVILEDVRAAGYTFGDPRHPWPVARVQQALAQLARLHAATWGAKQADFPWVPRAFGMRDVIEGMMSEENWARRFADPAVRPPIPEVFWAHRERMVRCLRTLWGSTATITTTTTTGTGSEKKKSSSGSSHNSSPSMVCMVHGDTQVGNTFLDPQGRPGFLDWQCPHVNSAAHDVTYFMSGALTIEDRRTHERALYGFYLEELCRAGGPKFEVDEVWDEYRKYQMQGFAWALAGPMMQPKEIVDAISERHCTAILDHGTLELLESLAEA